MTYALDSAIRYRHLASLGASPLFHKSPPARAGGTAGCWAFPGPGKPEQPFTTNTPQTLAPPSDPWWHLPAGGAPD
jgi:hypothetical protein